MYAIETHDLTKHFLHGKIKALQEFTLQIEPGKIFGLLGPNGAGKTTLIKILLSILHPTKGEAKLLGYPITDYTIHAKTGYLSENHRFPEFLTGEQVLYYYGKMSGMSKQILNDKIPQLLAIVKLSDFKNLKIRKYSKGMMQRLGIAHALINDPELLFLDEPTDGIDPVGRREIRDLLKSLQNRGKTIFLNSHLLSEVERISDEIAILKNGKLLQQGRVEDFIAIKQQYQLQLENGKTSIKEICERLTISHSLIKEFHTISVKDDAQLNQLIDELRENGALIQAIIPRKISLEDFFIDVIESDKGGKN